MGYQFVEWVRFNKFWLVLCIIIDIPQGHKDIIEVRFGSILDDLI